jgi:hypothetical protein
MNNIDVEIRVRFELTHTELQSAAFNRSATESNFGILCKTRTCNLRLRKPALSFIELTGFIQKTSAVPARGRSA